MNATDMARGPNRVGLLALVAPRTVLLLAMGLTLALMAASGRLAPVITSDTAGYLEPWTWSSLWGQRRAPLLGFLLAPFGGDFTLYPAIVIGLFFAAVYYLSRSLVAFGVSERAALALTLPLIMSNSLLRYGTDVHPEFPAIVFLLYALAEIFRLLEPANRTAWRYAAFGAALGGAYLLRPSLLPFIVLLPVLFAALGYVSQRRSHARTALALLAVGAAPFILVSTVRYYAVNDFNVVSFGGFAMTGVAASIVTEPLIDDLDPEHRDLARRIVAERDAMTSAGEISPMAIYYYSVDAQSFPRSYRRTALAHFDILANNFDELVYKVVLPARQPGETWVAFNERMMSFSVDVVRAAPVDYALWIVGAIRSAAGTATVHNFAFTGGLIALLAVYLSLLLAGRVRRLAFPQLDVPVLTLITVVFTVGGGALSVMVIYPAMRYVSTAALFLPAFLFYLAIQLAATALESTAPKEAAFSPSRDAAGRSVLTT